MSVQEEGPLEQRERFQRSKATTYYGNDTPSGLTPPIPSEIQKGIELSLIASTVRPVRTKRQRMMTPEEEQEYLLQRMRERDLQGQFRHLDWELRASDEMAETLAYCKRARAFARQCGLEWKPTTKAPSRFNVPPRRTR